MYSRGSAQEGGTSNTGQDNSALLLGDPSPATQSTTQRRENLATVFEAPLQTTNSATEGAQRFPESTRQLSQVFPPNPTASEQTVQAFFADELPSPALRPTSYQILPQAIFAMDDVAEESTPPQTHNDYATPSGYRTENRNSSSLNIRATPYLSADTILTGRCPIQNDCLTQREDWAFLHPRAAPPPPTIDATNTEGPVLPGTENESKSHTPIPSPGGVDSTGGTLGTITTSVEATESRDEPLIVAQDLSSHPPRPAERAPPAQGTSLITIALAKAAEESPLTPSQNGSSFPPHPPTPPLQTPTSSSSTPQPSSQSTDTSFFSFSSSSSRISASETTPLVNYLQVLEGEDSIPKLIYVVGSLIIIFAIVCFIWSYVVESRDGGEEVGVI